MGVTDRAPQDSGNVIFPRRKQGQHNKKHGRKEGVVVTIEILESVFHMPLHKACKSLGVCATALKRACRKLGVQKWPYRDQQGQTQRSFTPEENACVPKQIRAAAAATAAAAASRQALISMGINVGRAAGRQDTNPATWASRSSSVDSTACSSPEDSAESTPADAIDVEEHIIQAPADVEETSLRSRAAPQPYATDCNNPAQAETRVEVKHEKDLNSFLANTATTSHDYQADPADTPAAVDDDAVSSCFSDEHSWSSSSTSSSGPSSPSRNYEPAKPADISPFAAMAQLNSRIPTASEVSSSSACVQRQATRPKVSAAARKSTSNITVMPTEPQVVPKAVIPVPFVPVTEEVVEQGVKDATQDSSNVIFPRRKQGQHKKNGRKEGVVVTMDILQTVFHMPLHKACNALGVCATALKRACRKLGVLKWPYRDQQCQTHRSVGVSSNDDELAPTASRGSLGASASHAQRGRSTGGMRVGTRGASMRLGARATAAPTTKECNGVVKVERGMSRDSSEVKSHERARENSSDIESSVDTQIHAEHEEAEDQLHDDESCNVVMGNVMAPEDTDDLRVWGYPSAVVQGGEAAEEDDFDSLDSEEDGLMADELESWGLTEARLENMGAPGTGLLLEDCLKV